MEIDKVMEMSLDEYIDNTKKSKLSSSSNNNNNISGSSSLNEGTFKAERRRYDKNEEEEEELKLNKEDGDDDLGIWKGPDEKTNYLDLDFEKDDFDRMYEALSIDSLQNQNVQRQQQQQQLQRVQNGGGGRFDLRERISGSGVSMLPPVQSQQWRLMHPNVGTQRPAGMPPLVPQDGPVGNRRQDNNNYHQNNRRQRWHNSNNNTHNIRGRAVGGGGGNWGKNNYRGGGYNNNGRVHRINQQQQPFRNNQQMILNQSLKAVLDKLSGSNNSNGPPQVTIEVQSDSLDLRPGAPTNFNYGRSAPTAAAAAVGRAPMTAAAVAASNLESSSSSSSSSAAAAATLNSSGAEGIKALLGIGQNVNNEMMPMLASKFLDLFQNCTQQTVHKPVYDMKLQKEIHGIQKKSLMYSCPGGEVVSSDGAGINNCEIIPRTSGVSMNYRFA